MNNFQVSSFKSSYPIEEKGIELFLSSGFIKGIGKTHAKTIVKAFGKNSLSILEDSPEKTIKSFLNGIGKKNV